MTTAIPGDAIFQNPASPFSAGNPAFVLTATTTGAAHTLHTAATGLDDVDFVTVWAWNNTGVDDEVTLEIGGVTCGPITVATAVAPAVIIARLPMNNGNTLKAFAGTTATVGVAISVTSIISQAQ